MKTFISLTFLFVLSSTCPSGWIQYPNENICLYLLDIPQNYTQHEKQCEEFGGNVVKITNIYENSFIGTLLQSLHHEIPYIGMRKLDNGTWIYSDGTKPTYYNWEINSPRWFDDCATMNILQKWTSTDCGLPRPAFCSAQNSAVGLKN